MMKKNIRVQIKSLLKQALKYEKDGQDDKAYNNYLKCISFDDGSIPQNDDDYAIMEDLFMAWFRYALILIDRKEWEMAIKASQRILQYAPLKHHAFTLLGQCYLEQNKPVEAENAFRESISLKPRPEVLMHLYYLLYHYFEDREEEALNCLNMVLDLDPNYEEAHYNLGCHHKLEGNYIEAKKHFEKAIQIDPQYAEAYAELSHILLIEEKSKKSKDLQDKIEEYLRKSIESNPSYGWSRYYLANAFWTHGKIQKAYEQYKELIKIWPEDSMPYWTTGDFLACEDINQIEAEYYLRKALELDPECDAAHYHFGKALLKWNRVMEAKNELEMAAQLGNKAAKKLLNSLAKNRE